MSTVIRLRILSWAGLLTDAAKLVHIPASPAIRRGLHVFFWLLLVLAGLVFWFGIFFSVGFFFVA